MPERLLQAERQILGYDPQFDIRDFRSTPPEQLPQLETRTRNNLETMLGERFNVEISKIPYNVEDGQLKSPDHNEPFLEIIKRGQKYRQDQGSTETERELAEVKGFEKVQEIIINPDFPQGKKLIVISPKGNTDSIYQHNFVDIYTKTEGDTVEMSRITCKFSLPEFNDTTDTIDPFNNLPQNPTDADFLSTPLETYKSIEEIQEDFSPEENILNIDEYNRLIEATSPLITSYINTLSSNKPEYELAISYNALLNYSDSIINHQSSINNHSDSQLTLHSSEILIDFYGSLPVRQVQAGCGNQAGFNIAQSPTLNPYSVSEFGFGQDQYGTLEINCQGCGATYQRNPGTLEKNCRNCGGTKGIVC